MIYSREFQKAAWDLLEDMALRFGHKMSLSRTHVVEAGPQADRTVLGGSGNFRRWHVAERGGSLGSVLGVFSSLALSWFVLCFCSPRTKEQSLSLAAPSMVFRQSTRGHEIIDWALCNHKQGTPSSLLSVLPDILAPAIKSQ